MAGLVPAIYVWGKQWPPCLRQTTWLPGTRPGMTDNGCVLKYQSCGLKRRLTPQPARVAAISSVTKCLALSWS